MAAARYRVESDLFAGPIDLLLFLVRRSEVDPKRLSLAAIVSQFREMVAALELIGETVDIDFAGDFVVAMATLVEVKSAQALPHETEPQPELPEESTIRTDDDLVARLIQYRQFKDAAAVLGERAAARRQRYERQADDRPPGKSDPTRDRIRGIELWDLLAAFARIAATQLDRGVETIRDDQTPVHVYVDRVGERVRAAGPTRFVDLFDGDRSRSRVVGTFLAVLELVRHHRFRATQDAAGAITIEPPDPDGGDLDGGVLDNRPNLVAGAEEE